MKRFAQILHDRAHWIFDAGEKPEYASDIVLIDITDKPEVQEGWSYNSKTKEFKEPAPAKVIESEPTITEQLMAESQYQTALLEMNMMGAM